MCPFAATLPLRVIITHDVWATGGAVWALTAAVGSGGGPPCTACGGAQKRRHWSPSSSVAQQTLFTMFSTLTFNDNMSNYAATYTSTRNTYLEAAKALKEATGPYKATRDAYVAATATYTKSLYE